MKQEQFSEARPLSQEKQNLLDAANYIRKHGWCQWTSETEDGRVCIAGAFGRTFGLNYDTTGDVLRNYLCVDSLSAWNDALGRTVDQVLSALEAAALS